MTIEDTLLGLVGGFLISMVTFYISMKITRRKERREELKKHVRKFFPLLRELADDLSYAISTIMRSEPNDASLENLLEKIIAILNSFRKAYSDFREAGLEPELESSDKKLSNELKGLFITWKMDDHTSLHNKLNSYYSKVLVCRNLLESYLKR